MKISKTIEVEICDFCKKPDSFGFDKCRICGKASCLDCKSVHRFRHSISFSGSEDGYYCTDCIIERRRLGVDELFNAYDALNNLIGIRSVAEEHFRKDATRLSERIAFLLANSDKQV